MLTNKQRTSKAVFILILFNCIFIGNNVASGFAEGDLMYRFREGETVTAFSFLLLGLTSICSLSTFLLKNKISAGKPMIKFWLLCACGFFFLGIDEFFMIHEGLDEGVGKLFGKDIKHLNLDNMVLLAYGLVAVAVCWFFRSEILENKTFLTFLIFGACGLGGTIIFHGLERINIIYEVIEECFKFIGVSCFFTGFLLYYMSLLDRLSIQEL